MAYDPDRPEQPRVEPEIIPPDRSRRQSDWRQSPYASGPTYGTRRVYVGRIGPLGMVLLLAAIAAIIVIAFVGALLIWIPLVAFFVIVAAFFRLLRR